MPTAADLKVDAKEDPRPLYTLIACGTIAALCVGLSFITTASNDAEEFGYGMYGQPYEGDAGRSVAYDEQEQRATPVEV
jgi:hypothetical protein